MSDKLLPPIITGLVTISIFLFTIWKDKIKDNRKRRKENSQKNVYLLNLLQDTIQHIEGQIQHNKVLINDLRASPTSASILTYMPIKYLDRLSAVLANDSYFAAFNNIYSKIDEEKRIKIYNDLAIDIDLFHGYMTELYIYIEKGSEYYENFKSNYFEASKLLIRNLGDLHLKVSGPDRKDMDTEELSSVLDKFNYEDIINALKTHDMIYMNKLVGQLQQKLVSLLVPLFLYEKSVTSLCTDCQNANEQYHGLINGNNNLRESVEQLNITMQHTLTDFKQKLSMMKGALK
ncbi:hypothetical protein CPT03_07070 [Pedobacter ginsengisoli]|uniref:Uncharacterized protein n=1 Tax=Pedobacter ginsengisoli TaxID=363852 RepID=A0A2D1U3R8_9SPHI|nr:hypothetical protein [Pedobacter ginsengisoli]ATP56246.1 hypothetical protein CPT03_07070 [Pedobacter ginsengisoli]